MSERLRRGRPAAANVLPRETVSGYGRDGAGRRRSTIFELGAVLVQALLIATAVRTFGFQSFNIPSGSLVPTLLPGDYVFVSKYAYGYSHFSLPFDAVQFSGRLFGAEPKRGDIVVFHNTRDDGKDYIKRVIGLPGERIRITDAMIFIDDVPVRKVRAGSFETDKPDHVLRRVPRYRETLPNGVSYDTIEIEDGRAYLSNTGEYVVPAGNYFMMGDNREDSQDSRVPSRVGFVPYENLIGRAEMIYFSTELTTDDTGRPESAWKALVKSGVRWDRLLRGVH